MSQTLNLANFQSLNIVKQTSLDGDAVAGASSLKLLSNTDFVAGTVLVGAPGSPRAELITITAPSGATDIPLSGTTKFEHNDGEPVYMLYGNKLKIYTSADQYGTGQQPDDANFSLLTTVDIDGSKVSTEYTDATSPEGTWYKYTYYNSSNSAESNLADSRAYQGGQTHYVSLDQVRKAAGFDKSPNITDDVVAEKRDAAEREINGALLGVYNFPLPQPTNPIIQQIAMNIAAGELMRQEYSNISISMAEMGEKKADTARHGGGAITSLDELALREVVLHDAQFVDEATDTGHGFSGYPDETTNTSTNPDPTIGTDSGPYFEANEVY